MQDRESFKSRYHQFFEHTIYDKDHIQASVDCSATQEQHSLVVTSRTN
jgi:hypothetical protein